MKTWRITLFHTAEIEAETRREAIDTAIQKHGLDIRADAIKARELQNPH